VFCNLIRPVQLAWIRATRSTETLELVRRTPLEHRFRRMRNRAMIRDNGRAPEKVAHLSDLIQLTAAFQALSSVERDTDDIPF
jgi:hypothetical protein